MSIHIPKTFLFTFALLITGMATSSHALLYYLDSEDTCYFSCNEGDTTCPAGFTLYPDQEACGNYSSLSADACVGAATGACGSGNFYVDYDPGLLDTFQVEKVTLPNGTVYTGDQAVDFLNKKMPASKTPKH
jgi:hypothetical protein